MNWRDAGWSGVLALALLLGTMPRAGAAGARWVVISLPGLRLRDLDDPDLPSLRSIAREGALALMNTVTLAPFVPDTGHASDLASAYLTIGAGRRVSAPPVPDPGLKARELPAAYWRSVQERNPGLGGLVPAGRWYASGVRVGMIAAADAHGGAEALLALTAPGVPVDAGSAGARWLRRDAAAPYGVIADVERMAAAAARLVREVDLIWLDPGDLQRAEAYSFWCLPAAAAQHRTGALRNADKLLALLEQHEALSGRGVLIVSPTAAGGRWALAPVVWAPPARRPGLLASGATHLVGLVANTELMPHLLASAAGSTRSGSTIRVVPSERPMAALRRLEARSNLADRTRAATLPWMKAWLLLGVAAMILGRSPGIGRAHRWLALWPMAVPAAAMAIGGIVTGDVWPAIAAGVGVAIAVCAEPARQGILAAGWIFLTLLPDLFLGAPILRWSPLGYSLALGARYYGIGNEWMGYLVGAAVVVGVMLGREGGRKEGTRAGSERARGRSLIRLSVAPSLGRSLPPSFVSVLPSAAVFVALGSPAWGANFGGALTAAAAIAAIFWVGSSRQDRRLALLLGVGLGIGVLLVAGLDAMRPPALQTHLGRLVNAIRAGGIAPLAQMVNGKLATSLRLLHNFWGLLLGCELAACWWLDRTARERRGRSPAGGTVWTGAEKRLPAGEAERHTGARFAVLALSAIAALVLNDSGVIAASLMLSLAPLFVVEPRE